MNDKPNALFLWMKNMRSLFRVTIETNKDLNEKYYNLNSTDKVILLEATIMEYAGIAMDTDKIMEILKQNIRIQELMNKQ